MASGVPYPTTAERNFDKTLIAKAALRLQFQHSRRISETRNPWRIFFHVRHELQQLPMRHLWLLHLPC